MNSDNVSLPVPGGSVAGRVRCKAILWSRLLSFVIPTLREARTIRSLMGRMWARFDLYDDACLYDGTCEVIVVDGTGRCGFQSLDAESKSSRKERVLQGAEG
jgi:hypothetical protein